MSVSKLTALLQRYRPVIQYDSHESFFADSAAMMTDRVTPGSGRGRHCNTLKNGAGKVIASAKPSAGQPQLNLDFLRMKYAIGRAAHRDDYLDATGRDYVADARRMHALPKYRNQIYGHGVTDEQGRLWLQYWFFYYYNDKAFMGIGLHEGDWEMVQIRLDRQNKPNVLTYSQHLEGARTSWANVVRAMTTDGPVPVVFSARGSHACYFRPGVYKEAPVVPDYCDAKGLRIRPDLVVISANSPAWVRWPGLWGSTPRRNYVESHSPRGPKQQWQLARSGNLPQQGAPGSAPRCPGAAEGGGCAGTEDRRPSGRRPRCDRLPLQEADGWPASSGWHRRQHRRSRRRVAARDLQLPCDRPEGVGRAPARARASSVRGPCHCVLAGRRRRRRCDPTARQLRNTLRAAFSRPPGKPPGFPRPLAPVRALRGQALRAGALTVGEHRARVEAKPIKEASVTAVAERQLRTRARGRDGRSEPCP